MWRPRDSLIETRAGNARTPRSFTDLWRYTFAIGHSGEVSPIALTQRLFGIWAMLLFGLIGYVLRQMNYPTALLVLGIIDESLLNKHVRLGSTLSNRDLMPLFARPSSLTFELVIAITPQLSFPLNRRQLPGYSRYHHRQDQHE